MQNFVLQFMPVGQFMKNLFFNSRKAKPCNSSLRIRYIFANIQRYFHAFSEFFARFHFFFADTIDNRETAFHTVATANFCKFHQRVKAHFLEL